MSAILRYHERTRHAPGAYARSLGYLDWDSQPDPFRRFDGAPCHLLPFSDDPGPDFEPALVEGRVVPQPVTILGLAQLLHDALGLSAEKAHGEARWWLRMNPSSGNLHPTEGYVVGDVPGLGAGVFHYAPREHALERRAVLPDWPRFAGDLPPGAVLVCLSSIPWRESWKYGERALRYCQHDLGHAVACVAIAAAALGWTCRLLECGGDAELAALLGLDDLRGDEGEIPETVLVVGPGTGDIPLAQQRFIRLPRPGAFAGSPNSLSTEHQDWPVIDEAVELTARLGPAPLTWWEERATPAPTVVGTSGHPLRRVIAGRRSAVSMDGRTGLTTPAFLQILSRCLPGGGRVPFASLPWAPAIHLALFVHRVAGLDPGVYVLFRGAEAGLREALPGLGEEAIPGGLPLFRLRAGDVRALAADLACGQSIAADGAFAVAMLADFDRLAVGDWAWRRLHWEAGAIGQVLYLEAGASGVAATGIGCFFDEATHRALGLAARRWRTVYHFTVGGAVEDARLQTVDPYRARRG